MEHPNRRRYPNQAMFVVVVAEQVHFRSIARKRVHPSESVIAASGASDTLPFRDAACVGWGTAAENTGDTILNLRSGSGSEAMARIARAVPPASRTTLFNA